MTTQAPTRLVDVIGRSIAGCRIAGWHVVAVELGWREYGQLHREVYADQPDPRRLVGWGEGGPSLWLAPMASRCRLHVAIDMAADGEETG